MNSSEVPLDLQGPVDRLFDRMEADFAGTPAIEHLKAIARRFADKIAMSDGIHHITAITENTADTRLIPATGDGLDLVLAEGLQHHLFLGRVVGKV